MRGAVVGFVVFVGLGIWAQIVTESRSWNLEDLAEWARYQVNYWTLITAILVGAVGAVMGGLVETIIWCIGFLLHWRWASDPTMLHLKQKRE